MINGANNKYSNTQSIIKTGRAPNGDQSRYYWTSKWSQRKTKCKWQNTYISTQINFVKHSEKVNGDLK